MQYTSCFQQWFSLETTVANWYFLLLISFVHTLPHFVSLSSSIVTATRASLIRASWKLANSSLLAGLQTLILLKKGEQVAPAENSSQKMARRQQTDWQEQQKENKSSPYGRQEKENVSSFNCKAWRIGTVRRQKRTLEIRFIFRGRQDTGEIVDLGVLGHASTGSNRIGVYHYVGWKMWHLYSHSCLATLKLSSWFLML